MKKILLVFLLLTFNLSFSQTTEEPNSSDSDVAFAVIENVPVYEGCTGPGNVALKNCMSEKISQHVVENFNLSLAENLGLAAGKQRIFVNFKIDKEGNVVDIAARAPHPALETEAVRVVSLIPKLKPSFQKGKPVGVLYSLPIIFEIEESAKEKRKRLKKARKSSKN